MTLKILAGLAAGLTATAAIAQAPQAGLAPGARDGVQTRAEAVQRAQAMFQRLDLNRDQLLTPEEMQAARQQMRDRMAQRMADPARRQQRADRAFARMDLNRDGSISRAEFDQARAQRMAMGQRNGGVRSMNGGRMFAMADANRDGRLTLQEVTAGALQRFDRMDLNRDGTLTREERIQARGQWRAQRRG